MTVSRRDFFVSAGVPLVALALFGCSTDNAAPAPSEPADSTPSSDRLLLVEKDALVSGNPSEVVSEQSIWTMHETATSRSSLVRIDGVTPAASHDARRMLIVLSGAVEVTLPDRGESISQGGYIDIPAGIEYSLAPSGSDTPLVVGFEVPRIDFAATPPASGFSVTPDAVPVARNLDDIMADVPSWDDPSDRGWTLAKNADLRVNLVEMRSELKNHVHPDADHSLILLAGSARVVTPNEEHTLDVGTYVSIPAGLAHKYFVDGDRTALFVSFDAPAYDSAKTVYLD